MTARPLVAAMTGVRGACRRTPSLPGKRPALLVIDVGWAFSGDKPEPILDSIKRWRSSCGADSRVAVDHTKSLIDKARARGIPVIYTTAAYRDDNWDAGSWRWKNRRQDGHVGGPPDALDGNEIVAPIAPGPPGQFDLLQGAGRPAQSRAA